MKEEYWIKRNESVDWDVDKEREEKKIDYDVMRRKRTEETAVTIVAVSILIIFFPSVFGESLKNYLIIVGCLLIVAIPAFIIVWKKRNDPVVVKGYFETRAGAERYIKYLRRRK